MAIARGKLDLGKKEWEKEELDQQVSYISDDAFDLNLFSFFSWFGFLKNYKI